jgi:hypothetical protein
VPEAVSLSVAERVPVLEAVPEVVGDVVSVTPTVWYSVAVPSVFISLTEMVTVALSNMEPETVSMVIAVASVAVPVRPEAVLVAVPDDALEADIVSVRLGPLPVTVAEAEPDAVPDSG